MAAAVLLAFVAAASTARATWSIVAVDPETREVGIAGASCIAGSEIIAGLAPGRGVVAAQAFANQAGRDFGTRMLARGGSPQQVIDAIASRSFDSNFLFDLYKWRQYGVAALGSETVPANFTGSSTLSWSGAALGPGVSVQGNTLYGREVVENPLARFEERKGCPLADRLMAALVAGSEAGGDRRCVRELTALSAFIMVARPDDDPSAPHLQLVVTREGEAGAGILTILFREFWRNFVAPATGGAEDNPVNRLRQQYAGWRSSRGADAGCAP